MKICSLCGKSKSKTEYYFRNKQTGNLHTQCKSCYNAKRNRTWAEYYTKHGEKYRQAALRRKHTLKTRLRNQILLYLSDKACAHCGINDIRVLDFDHTNPSDKAFGISRAISDIKSWNKIKQEIEKCQILCANCHKIKTAEEQNWYRQTAA